MIFNLIALCLAVAVPGGLFALWLGSLENERYRNALYKLHLLRTGLLHMAFSSDKRFPSSNPTLKNFKADKSKSLVFIRHGESAWNVVFNKGFGSDFPGRLTSALREETNMFTTLDSVFFDSPLSKFGTDQACDLRTFVKENLTTKELGSSVIVSSNLRRALSTGVISLWDRLSSTKEKISILSSLQEVTFNVDGVSLAKKFSFPQLSKDEMSAVDGFNAKEIFECGENLGDKPIKSSGYERLLDFCGWVFAEERKDIDTVIACGHSLYFRYFFRTFLDAADSHVAKKFKMRNCSVVSFELQQGTTADGKLFYRIPEESVDALYLGFEEKKAKAKTE